ncbi:NACHT domain-containing protein [Spirosoma radiotolerans]|nr:hypothetical protein [Spirosoma radiotolerans]
MPLITSSALTGFGSWLLKKGGDTFIKGFSKDEVNKRFEKCLLKASSELNKKYPNAFGEDIKNYLQNDDIKNELFKMLFTESNIEIDVLKQYIDFDTLPDGFLIDLIANIKSSLSTDTKINLIISNKKIYDIVKDSSDSMSQLINESKRVNEGVVDIREKLNTLFKNKFSYDNFLINYFGSLKTSIIDVNFFGLGIEQTYKKPRVNLKEIFVKPLFKYKKQGNSDDAVIVENSVKITKDSFCIIEADFLTRIPNNIVVLGNPGAGKSLLIRAIIYAIINKDDSVISAENIFSYLPIRIELRKYLIYKKTNSKNLLNYIPHLFELEYGLNFINTDDLKEILLNEKVIVFFDGLDEIFDLNEKYNVKNDIVNFTNTYKNKAIVTSRIVGYEDAKLDNSYLEFEMEDFNDDQITEYVDKWYKFEETDEDKRNIEIKEFSQVKDELSNLIKNPLLLSLIVILYRNNLKIPESKLEIYQSCTKTLVHKWDSIKQLDFSVNKEILDSKEVLLADLAFWQYKIQSETPDKLTNATALATVTNSIMLRLKISEWATARTIAESFLTYAEKRSIYFDNNFTHKTFLEYYTAFWIYSNCDKKYAVQKRDMIVDQYISNPYWYIVFELLLNMIDNEQSDDEIIDGIYQRQIDRDWRSLQFLIGALPSIKNISQEQTVQLFANTFSFLLTSESNEINSSRSKETNKSEASVMGTYDALDSIANSKDYRSLFIDTVVKLYDKGGDNKPKIFSLVYEIIALRDVDIFGVFRDHDIEFINTIKTDPNTYMLYFYNIKDIDELFSELIVYIKKFGKDDFFTSPYTKFAGWTHISLAQNFFTVWLSKPITDINYYLDELSKCGIDRQTILSNSESIEIVFYSNTSRMKEVLLALDNEKDFFTKSILLSMFFSMYSFRNSYDNVGVSLDSILDIDISTSLKKAVKSVMSKKFSHAKTMVDYVMNKISIN